MQRQPVFAGVLALAVSALLLAPSHTLRAREQGPSTSLRAGNKKPSLSLKASPAIAFAPARITMQAELKGGSNDLEDFYCPTVEWDWGDLTTSVNEPDCSPYEAGKSEIKRRYTVQHQFKNPGGFNVMLRLKKGSRVVASANTQVQVRAGVGHDGF